MGSESATSKIYKLSWVAYIRLFVMSGVQILIGMVLSGIFERQWIIGVAVGLAIVWFVYQVTYTRSIKIYTDEAGVWIYQGVFPWQKGIFGVKWRDVDGALYTSGFISWLCRSYAIHVGHRYTKGSEMAVRHVRHGNQFVEHVNAEHQERVKEVPTAPPENSLMGG